VFWTASIPTAVPRGGLFWLAAPRPAFDLRFRRVPAGL